MWRHERRVLELGAQPADEAARFFGGALGVERDQAFEQRLVEFAHGVIAVAALGCGALPLTACISGARSDQP
ncbi:MAG: hypothetical protein U1F26_03300 [Lysobacterales bacterium]